MRDAQGMVKCKISFHEIGKFFYTDINLLRRTVQIVRKTEGSQNGTTDAESFCVTDPKLSIGS